MLSTKQESRLGRKGQAGFTLVESIIIVVLMVAVGFTIYYLGWGSKERARDVVVTANDIKTMQTAVTAYALESNGLFPTGDGKLPSGNDYKPIMWTASFTNDAGKTKTFYPDFVERLPKYWDQGIWRLDKGGSVSVEPTPEP